MNYSLKKENQMTAIEILRLAATTEFRPFDKADWMSFAGCNSQNPLIGEAGNYIVIIDDEVIAVIDEDNNEFSVQVSLVEK
jgi:hypothetical protein